MLFPGMIFLILFHLIPMVGIIMAFQNFQPAKEFSAPSGSAWKISGVFFSFPTPGRSSGTR